MTDNNLQNQNIGKIFMTIGHELLKLCDSKYKIRNAKGLFTYYVVSRERESFQIMMVDYERRRDLAID